MERLTKVNSMKTSTMEQVFRSSLMAQFTEVNSSKDKDKVMGPSSIQMATVIKVNSIEMGVQDSENSNGKMEKFILEKCRMAKCMEVEFSNYLLESYMMVASNRAKRMEKVRRQIQQIIQLSRVLGRMT